MNRTDKERFNQLKGFGKDIVVLICDELIDFTLLSFQNETTWIPLPMAIHEKLHKSMEEHKLVFHESVRQPLIIFGKDEAIFKQYLLTLKLWLGRNKKQPLRPKDEGMGLMASVFKSRAFGFV